MFKFHGHPAFFCLRAHISYHPRGFGHCPVIYPDLMAVDSGKGSVGSVLRGVCGNDFDGQVIPVVSVECIAFPGCILRDRIAVFQRNETVIGFSCVCLWQPESAKERGPAAETVVPADGVSPSSPPEDAIRPISP